MHKQILTSMFLFSSLAGFACAASGYSVKFYGPVQIGATELKAGDYKVEMQGDKAVFKSGKSAIEIPATLEKSDKKFTSTLLLSEDSKVSEIDVAGTNIKIMFAPAPTGLAIK